MTKAHGLGRQQTLHPYPGARAFRRSEAAFFFGREDESQEVASAWLSERVLVLHGPSTAGKTSLLHAGVLPRMTAAGTASVLPVGRFTTRLQSSGQRPRYAGALVGSWSGEEQPSLSGTSVLEFLAAYQAMSVEGSRTRPLLAAIDQFEDLFAVSRGHEERELVLDELAVSLEAIPALRLLLVIREDYLARLADFGSRFPVTAPRYIAIGRFGTDAAMDAISLPAAHSGHPFSSGIAERLAMELRRVTNTDIKADAAAEYQAEVEPLQLQVACQSLWAALPPGAGAITAEHLRAWGGVDGALLDFYASAVAVVAAGTGVAEARLRDWLPRAFITEQGTRNTVRRVDVTTAGMPSEIADDLARARILTEEYRDCALWYQLSYDRLVAIVRRAGAAGGPQVAPAAESGTETPADQYRDAGSMRRLADARVQQGNTARAAGNLAGAERNFRAALMTFFLLEDRYSAARMLSAIAELHFSEGDYAEAANLNQQAVERMPGDVQALTGLAYAQWHEGSPADAAATFDQALYWDRNTPLALAGRGQIRADLGEYEYALDDLDRALSLRLTREAETDARSARALALAGLGRVSEAEDELATTLRMDPERPRSRLRAGRIAAILGRLEQMRAEIERALAGRPPLSSAEQHSAHRILQHFGTGSAAGQ
jgi:tetratricopeptide (TPR) repeat protein